MVTNHGVRGSNPSRPQLAQKEKIFSFESRKIMVEIVNPKLWNLARLWVF